ncbi:ABC transporter permease [Ruminiclostridium sufflavum]|nr:ABC transporter permease [Ruminiclostridium sufflavum]
MRNPLNKRLNRELKHNFGRYTAIALMLIVTIALVSGFLVVADGVRTAFEDNRTSCKVEDGLFSSYYPVSEAALEKAERLGLSVYENYYIDADVLKNATLRIYKERENINLVTVMEGRLPAEGKEVALERLFAETNGLEIGDDISIGNTKMKITGFISLPDYSSLFKKNTDIMMDTFYFGVAVVTNETFASFSENGLIYNYSYYFDKRDLSDKEKRDLSEELSKTLVLNGVQLTNFCTAEKNQSISFVEEDMGSDIPMIKVFFYIILGIMAFVFAIVINSTIEEEAAVIGTLLASGYTKGELIFHYISLPVWITFISGAAGNLIGYTVMPDIFKGLYYGSYSLPPMKVAFNAEAFLLTTVLPIAVMVVINLFALNSRLSISPLRFLRRDLKKHSGKRAGRLPDISFISRFRLRIIFQNKGSYITLFFGMLFASFILMFGLCMTPMITHYMDEIKASAVSENQYILKLPVELENKEDSEKFTLYPLETYYRLAGKDIEVSVYGISENSSYFKGLDFAADEGGVYFSDGLAKKTGAEIGEVVSFTDPYSQEKYELKVVGTYDYAAGLAVFMENTRLNNLLDLGNDYFNGYFSNKGLNIDEKYLAAAINSKDLVKAGDQMLSSFGQMAPIFTIAAILIYMALMYILTKIVIDRNAVNISFMKVFGYEDKEIRKLYLNATTITVIASLILTLPLVYAGIKESFVIVLMKISGYLDIYIPLYLYLIIVAAGILSYFVINFFHIRRVNKIEMSLALKDKE